MGPGLPGTSGNYWTSAPTFPAYTNWVAYLGPNRTLHNSMLQEGGSYTYVYDPTNPVPTKGGNNLLLQCGPFDQSELEMRSDVLTFTSPPFTEEFAITGHMYANLFIASNCTDTDFTAKARDASKHDQISHAFF